LQCKLSVFATTFFSICSTKAIVASIFNMQQVLFVCRNFFKIAATFTFAADII